MNKFALVMAALLVGCADNPKKKDPDNSDKIVKIADANPAEIELKNPPEDFKNAAFEEDYISTADFIFSNPNTADHFSIIVPKGKISDTTSKLLITNSQGEVILDHTFPTYAFVSLYSISEMKYYKDVIEHIKERIKSNLSSERLSNPKGDRLFSAASKNEFSNYEVYLEYVKNNRSLYDFKLRGEDHNYFGYSEKDKKAVVVFTCC